MAERDGKHKQPATEAKPPAERPGPRRIVLPGEAGVRPPGSPGLPQGRKRAPIDPQLTAFLQLQQKALVAVPPSKVNVTGQGTLVLMDVDQAMVLLKVYETLGQTQGGVLVVPVSTEGKLAVAVGALTAQMAQTLKQIHEHLMAGGAVNLTARPGQKPDCAAGQPSVVPDKPEPAAEVKP